LKSGCKAEDLRLGAAARLTNVISIYCVVSWRTSWMTMINRIQPDADPDIALAPVEIKVLDKLRPDKTKSPKTLSNYLVKLAKLGG
jgi:hypothetical protein